MQPCKPRKTYDNPDTIVVSRDGTGAFRNISDAIEVCRAFMDYHKVIFVKKGTYKEKLIVPQWLTNIEICGEDRDKTIITWDDHANIILPTNGQGHGHLPHLHPEDRGQQHHAEEHHHREQRRTTGTGRGADTTGDRLTFVNCRFLGHQDTIYTGNANTRLYFKDCYIEGTTDFIFGPSTAWFEHCDIFCKANSYITAASTPQGRHPYGYVFNQLPHHRCQDVDKVYLGRPWRDYGYTVFMNSELPRQILPEGWHQWRPRP